MAWKVVATAVAFCLTLFLSQIPTSGQSSALVRVTPLGSHAGELCSADRALVFEDPSGIRILYDPAQTVDESDARLGDIHVMLLSHVHPDHIGTARPNRAGTGSCAAPGSGGANANSNFATIAAAKRAAVIVSTDLSGFLGSKIQNVRGAATPGCPSSGPDNETIVPAATVCMAGLNPASGTRLITRSGAASVRVAVVPAMHTNGVPAALLDAPLPNGLVANVGSAVGFVVMFSNGLRAYLTGDTGVTNEMDMIGRLYRPSLAVINVTDIFTTSPADAAFVMQQYIRPVTVMPSHVNEAATSGGVEIAGTRTERFARLVRGFAEVVIPLSDIPRMFDGEGRCVNCR